jgi:hypothetical protein
VGCRAAFFETGALKLLVEVMEEENSNVQDKNTKMKIVNTLSMVAETPLGKIIYIWTLSSLFSFCFELLKKKKSQKRFRF